MFTIQSIQRGTVVSEGDRETRDVTRRFWTTAFYKMPVADPVTLTPLGLDGDQVADTKYHGGAEKAILCYTAEHYDRWADELPDLGMSAGGLGENLTISGLDETSVCIGDRFAVADCVLEVSQPRQPCWKIARRWGEKTLTKRVGQTGRTGWYVRVIEPGTISPGDQMTLTARPQPDWTVARINDVFMGREVDRLAVIELMNMPELSPEWKKDLA